MKTEKISYTLLRVVVKLIEVDHKTRYYGTDEPLHEAEIHMIKSIKEHEGIHVTGLAQILGVTKGAVSQIVAKLSKKGMIIKGTDPSNLSRLLLRLTEKGETAYVYHEKYHKEFNDMVDSLICEASDDNKAFLKDFLTSLEAKIDDF